jgi:hypothetical protein
MRYTVIEEDLGFFLGAFQKFGVFAKTDVFGLSKAYSFHNEEEANEFIDEYLGRDRGDWKVVAIDTENKYIDVIDLLKNGYSKYTHNMADSIPMISSSIH